LKIDLDNSLPSHIISDKTRFCQVLSNLGNNAVKFTNSGSVLFAAKSIAKFYDEKGGNSRCRILVEVTDTGIGITPGDCKRLFQAFAQIDSSSARKYQGNGLG
jgi:two-component system sensor histidine kinase/response regulator